jgi:hypothetical protein
MKKQTEKKYLRGHGDCPHAKGDKHPENFVVTGIWTEDYDNGKLWTIQLSRSSAIIVP